MDRLVLTEMFLPSTVLLIPTLQQSELLHILPVSIASYLPYIPSRLATRRPHEFHHRKSPKSR